MAEDKKVGDVFEPQPESLRQAPEHLPGYRSTWMLSEVCGVSFMTIRRWAEESPTPHGTTSYRSMRWWSPDDARWFIKRAMTKASDKKTKWRPL